jgi:hypothetical protein
MFLNLSITLSHTYLPLVSHLCVNNKINNQQENASENHHINPSDPTDILNIASISLKVFGIFEIFDTVYHDR